ncbi:MAG: hypothetical protein JSR09_05665 [Bacteroidetes bacterium]|nr:hypothetical protein [Bacteroidota bacterium]MBS1649176.1 hypothetical protein [Bacteroidota bacterium]
MKKRILTGWNLKRILYVLIGLTIIIQSILQHEWIGVLLGSYFASMGVFSFGCAGGNCFNNNCYTDTKQPSIKGNKIEYEEIR